MDTGTAIAIAAPNVVALAAIGAAFWQQKRGFAHGRQLTDLESVRGVMSEAASVLHRTEYAINVAHAALFQWGRSLFDNEDRAKPYYRLEEVGREMDELLGQLRIRFGPQHPATIDFEAAVEAFLDVYRALGLVKMEEPALPGTPAVAEVAQMVKAQRERVERGQENFRVAQKLFVASAHAATGAKLPA